MKTLILHDESGEIIAISNLADLQASGSKFTEVGMIPAEGQRVLAVDLTGETRSGHCWNCMNSIE